MFSKSKINEPASKTTTDDAKPTATGAPSAPVSGDYKPSAPKPKPPASTLSADLHITGNIKTSGDIMQDVSLLTIGGQGVFVKEIEEALLSEKIDLAVHSMKDVPGENPEGLIFSAILPREDVRDVLVSRNNIKLEFMPKGAKIGTGSQRRGAQIKALLPDVSIVPLSKTGEKVKIKPKKLPFFKCGTELKKRVDG